MKNLIAQLNPFKKPTALEIAVADLEQAKRDYLVAMQHSEYYAAQASYNDGLISRLSNYIKESTDHSEYYAAQASYNDGLISSLSNYIKESTDA